MLIDAIKNSVRRQAQWSTTARLSSMRCSAAHSQSTSACPRSSLSRSNNDSSSMATTSENAIDPLLVVADEMASLTLNIRSLLGSGCPPLDSAAKYYVKGGGKSVRPLIVLLMARAVSFAPKCTNRLERQLKGGVDESFSPLDILRDFNPSQIIATISTSISRVAAAGLGAVSEIERNQDHGILPTQRRLAEITEMIHAASLLHDDVIDDAEMRRGSPSGNIAYGNKMSILAGDFLLGRASVALARLRDSEVVELMATVIANLVEGEFMQLKNTATEETTVATRETFDYYLQKTYLKTASLISKSCRSAAVLAGVTEDIVEAAYQYGRNLGLAFQLLDDMLDYTVTAKDLGKPAGADLKLGLATAPALFAWKEHPELGPIIRRKFSEPGDVERTRYLVEQSDGVRQTELLAEEYSEKARSALNVFPDSDAKSALMELTVTMQKRKK